VAFDERVAVEQIRAVLAEYEEDRASERPNYLRVVTRMASAVERLAPPNSIYRVRAERAQEKTLSINRSAYELAEILIGLQADYEAGFVRSVQELIHAAVFADFLEMADELLGKGYKDAAAVIAGSVLEEHLRQLATRFGISAQDANGRPLKADRVNADLTKAGAYNPLRQKQVTAWLGLRNHAAHGEYDKYDEPQVASLIRDVRDFMVAQPA
jgi:hypothetical protein